MNHQFETSTIDSSAGSLSGIDCTHGAPWACHVLQKHVFMTKSWPMGNVKNRMISCSIIELCGINLSKAFVVVLILLQKSVVGIQFA